MAARTPKSPDAPAQLVGELGLLVARTRRIVVSRAATRLSAQGESILAWQVLAMLVRNGATSQRAIAETAAQHPAGISRIVDELESRGMVERRRDVEDRRRVHVEVTEAGRRRFDELYPQVVEAVGEAVEVLSPSEQRSLRALLAKIVEADDARAQARKPRRGQH
jgi:DNA-binding MarR family transcriptional regulator